MAAFVVRMVRKTGAKEFESSTPTWAKLRSRARQAVENGRAAGPAFGASSPYKLQSRHPGRVNLRAARH